MIKITISPKFKYLTLILAFFLSTIVTHAATITSTPAGGAWATGTTWVGGVVPTGGDNVIIATTGNGSVNIAATVVQTAAGSVTISNGSILTMSGGTVTFGALTVNFGGTITVKRTTTILGASNISGRINFGSTVTTKRNITFNGAITLNSGAVWDETNAGTNTIADAYIIKSNFINNASTFTPLSTSPHNFTGTGTLSGSTTTTLPKATFTGPYANSGTVLCATSLTVTGTTLTNNGNITAPTLLSGTGGLTQGTAGVLTIGKTITIATLTATATGNVVNYNGAAQAVKVGNYSLLNLSGSGAKTLATGTTAIDFLSFSGTATATTVSNLTIASNLTVNTGTTFTTGATFNLGVGGATSVSGSLILGGTGAKVFSGDVTLNPGGSWNESGVATVDFGGNFTNNAATFTANSGTHTFSGGTKIISGNTATLIPTTTFTGVYAINSNFTAATQLTITGVSVTNNATTTATTSLTGTGTLVQGMNALLNIGGTLGINSLNAAASGNTVNYTSAGQIGFVTTYRNLTLSGSGIKTFATSPIVNEILSIEGTANPLVTVGAIVYGPSATLQYNTATPRTASSEEWISPFIGSGGVVIKNTGAITTPGNVQLGNNTNVPLNINSGATLNPGANLITFHGDFINDGTLTLGSGGLTISGTTLAHSIDDFSTTGPVTFAKSAGTATMVGNLNGGALFINGSGGIVNLGVGFVHTFSGSVTLNTGILNGGSSTLNANAVSPSAWNGTGSVFVPSNSTVNFGASGNQNVAANSTFYNLGFLGSGIKTLSNATTINKDFSVSGAAVSDLGSGLSHVAISLNLGGTPQIAGTWGGTASAALNKNATWFGNTATGTINISCAAPVAPVSGGNKIICSGATIPALTVTVSNGQVVDWYNQTAGGTLLLSNATSYTPTVAGTFYAETRVQATGCLSGTRTGVKLTINPKPVLLSLVGSTICASPGGNGTISSTTSQIGINYQLYNASNATIQVSQSGSGNALIWSSLAAGNGYYVIETNATTGCISNTATVNVVANPNPNALVLTGSTICASPGDDGTITSDTSQLGIEYQLYDSSNIEVGATQSGTGSALSWTNLNPGNGYYVKGTNTLTGCFSLNSNVVNILTVANPTALVITGSTICASPGTNGTITTSNSTSGVSYQLNDSLGNDIGAALNGTGAALTFTGIPAGTGYYVDGIRIANGCESPSSNSVDVITTANPTNKTITVSSASVCTGIGANIIVAGSLASENYQLRNNMGNVLVGSQFSGNGGALNLPTGNLSATTTYNVLVTTAATGCTTVLSTTPTITVTSNNTAGTASSSPTLCINTLLTNITRTTTGATGIGVPTGLPSGVTANWASNVLTVSGTPTSAGTFNYSIPLTGGCGSINAMGTITVTPSNTAGTASSTPTLCINTPLTAITHTTTGATGIGTAIGLPTGITASWSSNTITIIGTSTASGIFNYSIPLTGGCSNVNATGTITVTPSNTTGTASSTPTLCINTPLTAITHNTTGATGIGTAIGLPTGITASWSSNTITIIGTPTASGIFNYSIPLTGGCSNVNATGTITVTPNNAAGTASSTPTLCINTPLTAITHNTTGATGIGTAVGLPTGITASWSSNTITIIGTPTASGIFNYSIPLTGGCGSINATGTIMVTPSNTAGTASSTPTLCINTPLIAITHTTTGATGIGSPIGLPSGVSASWSANVISITGTPTASGIFNYSIPLIGGCSNVNATGTITVTPSNTAGAASFTPTLCINTPLTAITHTTTGASGIGSPIGLPSGVSASWSANVITIMGTPTASGIFNYSIPLTGGCGNANAMGTITVNPATVGGIVSGGTTICNGSSSGTLTLSSYVGTIVRWESSTDNFTTTTTIANVTNTYNSGALTQTTQFRAVLQSGVCATANSSATTVTVNPTTVGGAVSGGTTICSGSTSGTLTLSGYTGSILRWESSTDNFISNTAISNTTNTYTSGTLTQTTQFRAVIQNGVCATANSAATTVTVTPTTVGGSVSASQAICAGSQPADLILSGNTGSVLYWEQSSDSAFTSPTTIATTNVILSGATIGALTNTTYFRAIVQSGSCGVVASAYATITIGSTIWDGTQWSNGAPTSATAAIISGNFTSSGINIDACSLTVDTNAIVTITSGDTVTLNGALTVNSGSFTLENNANLLQSNNVVNSGNITVKRNSSALKRLDYTLWSSPVLGQQLLAFSPLTLANRFYDYAPSTNLYNAIAPTSDFQTASGYLIRVPNTHPLTPTIFSGVFTGVPNNGNYTKTLEVGDATHRFNLVGNPYPSPISMTAFVAENSNDITGTLYFWRKTNNTLSPSYCSWVGGTFVSNGEAQVFDPNGIIRTGQGFFVEATATGSLVSFANTQRIADSGNQFFRNSNTVEQHRIWLNATNAAGSYSQMEVGYVTNATQGLDSYDGKYINDGNVAFYSVVSDEKLVIQGRALPFDATDVVPLGFKTDIAGTYTIALDHVDGIFLGSQNILLKDNLTQTVHDLKANAYDFVSESGTFENRFEIIYLNTLAVSTISSVNNQIIAYKDHDHLIVKSGVVPLASVKVFDVQGRLLIEKKGINALEINLEAGWADGLLLIEVKSNTGATSVKKVLW